MKHIGLQFPVALLLACAALTVPECAGAAPESLTLSRADMLAQTHSHAMVMSFTGTYQQLSGLLLYDPVAKTCSIDATFTVSSMTAPNAMMHNQMMSKKVLDAADYPQTRYQGVCQGKLLVGNLTLRGQTHPFDMDITYLGNPTAPSAIHAEGTMNRFAWGVDGLRLTVGRDIRVTNDISLNGQPPVPAVLN